jgi:hypothetical protein
MIGPKYSVIAFMSKEEFEEGLNASPHRRLRSWCIDHTWGIVAVFLEDVTDNSPKVTKQPKGKK